MISGYIVLEDSSIYFHASENKITYTVTDIPTGRSETLCVEQVKFLKALAIAVHNDGMPEYEKDYDDAEMVQPKLGMLRWIP